MAARCLDSSGETQLRSDPAAASEEAKKGQQTDNSKDDDYECDHVVVISIRPDLEPSPLVDACAGMDLHQSTVRMWIDGASNTSNSSEARPRAAAFDVSVHDRYGPTTSRLRVKPTWRPHPSSSGRSSRPWPPEPEIYARPASVHFRDASCIGRIGEAGSAKGLEMAISPCK